MGLLPFTAVKGMHFCQGTFVGEFMKILQAQPQHYYGKMVGMMAGRFRIIVTILRNT